MPADVQTYFLYDWDEKAREIVMKTRSIVYVTLLPMTIWLLSCKTDAPVWKGTAEVRDNVTFVMNPKEPLYSNDVLRLEVDLVIEGDEEVEAQMFQNIVTFDVGPDGNIYVLDEQACNIKIFDHLGNHLRTIGRKGQGPGEFAIPIFLLFTPQGELLINDMGNRRLVFLSTEGEFLRQISIADKFLFMGPRVLTDGRIVASFIVPAQEPRSELHVFDSELKSLNVLASIQVGKPPKLNYFVGMQLTSLTWNMTYADEVIWGDFLKQAYELYVLSKDGEPVKNIARDYERIEITAAEKKVLLEKMFGNNPAAQNQWEVEFPVSYPPFSGISFDDEGRLYLKTYDKVEFEHMAYYDVFDAEGRYIAKILFEIPPMIMKEGFLYTIEENSDGFKLLKRYKMIWDL